ncbi:MAG: RNA polymerase sigma factor [Verrucomicrobiae bacterium]|nr:RNA polymerase sigma factor [Verrucomicrobiae bacterium]
MVGDVHLAEDVTQATFLALAKNAAQLTNCAVLAGWLHRTAQNIAAQTIRTDVRRRVREQEAATMNELIAPTPEADWEQIAPHLDAALGELTEPDRDAILLRYFERKSAREMAAQLGISDEAAQKRVSRAVERLREFLAKRGVTVGASGLAVVISAHAVQAAPAGLALTITTAATLTGATLATTATVTTTKAIAMTALQKAIVTTTIAILAGVGIHEARQNSKLREQNQQRQGLLHEQIQRIDAALMDATNRLANLRDENARLSRNADELLRLRGEIGTLRRSLREAENDGENLRLRQEVSQLEAMWNNWTNSTYFNNPYFQRDEWVERGTAEPINTLQTMLSAIKQRDDQRLAQLVSGSDETQLLDSILLPKRVWDKVIGVQIVDINIMTSDGQDSKAVIGTVLQKQRSPSESPGAPYDNSALEAYRNSEQSIRRWFFVKTNGQWLITGSG